MKITSKQRSNIYYALNCLMPPREAVACAMEKYDGLPTAALEHKLKNADKSEADSIKIVLAMRA